MYYSGIELWYDGVDDFGSWAENEAANLVVFNMRTQSITHRIPLENCGDGVKDDETQWFEECERFNQFYDACASDVTYDANKYCPGEYLYECANGGISDYCYWNEEAGYNENSDGFNWIETYGTDNIVAYLTEAPLS